MSGNLWMFSDMLDDEDIEMQKHDFITLYQGADYYGLGLKSFTRMAREAGAVYKIGKKVLIRRTIFDEYLRKIYKKEMEQKAFDDAEKSLVMRQGTIQQHQPSPAEMYHRPADLLPVPEQYLQFVPKYHWWSSLWRTLK